MVSLVYLQLLLLLVYLQLLLLLKGFEISFGIGLVMLEFSSIMYFLCGKFTIASFAFCKDLCFVNLIYFLANCMISFTVTR